MTILVAGASGQLARALRRLAPDEIKAIGRPALDLARPHTLASALEREAPNAVINAGAFTAVDKAESEPEAAMAANAEGPAALAALCARADIPLIHVSTDYVFAGDKSAPYVEDDPTGPVTAYGRSKLAGERAVLSAGPRMIVARTAWVYDAEGHNFVRTMLRLARTRSEISVVDDQLGCPTFADDLAAGLIAMARRAADSPAPALYGVFHLSGADCLSWRSFAEAIFAGAATRGGPNARVLPIATADYPTPARRPLNSRLDCAKARERYGIALPGWRDSLGVCLDKIAAAGWPA